MPDNPCKRVARALLILNAKLRTVAVAKIKLRDVAMKMLFAAMLVDTLHSALEDRIVAFHRIGVDFAAHVLVALVGDAKRTPEARLDLVRASVAELEVHTMPVPFAATCAHWTVETAKVVGVDIAAVGEPAPIYQPTRE